jgi:cytochrome o ubiquinol oxidase subunit 2
MNFKVNVVSDPEFSRWVELTSGTNVVLDAATYSELAKQSANVKPATYRFVKDSRLFEMIVSQEIPPGPGPRPVQPDKSEGKPCSVS